MMKLKTALNRCVKRRKNKVLASLIRHGLVAPALLTASLNAQALSSCETTIQLTLHGQTAMTPIISIITRHGEQVSTDSRHTYIAPYLVALVTKSQQHWGTLPDLGFSQQGPSSSWTWGNNNA